MKRRAMNAALCALAVAALGMLSPAAQAQTYKAEYKLSTVVGTAFPWGKGGEIWANKVREKTNGRINIKLYPGVSLIQGDQTREFSALRQGVIDMAVPARDHLGRVAGGKLDQQEVQHHHGEQQADGVRRRRAEPAQACHRSAPAAPCAQATSSRGESSGSVRSW